MCAYISFASAAFMSGQRIKQNAPYASSHLIQFITPLNLKITTRGLTSDQLKMAHLATWQGKDSGIAPHLQATEDQHRGERLPLLTMVSYLRA